jgi:autotransporter-associated beta strand protein
LSPNSAFTVNSQLDLNGFSNTIGSLAGSGIVTNDGPVAATLAVGNNNASTTFSGILQDGTSSLALTKIGSGILTLSGVNTYTGRTTISGGAITTQNASALGTGPVTFANGTALNVQNFLNVNGNWTVNPGSATVNGGTVQTFGDFNLGGGGTLIANANFTVPGTANINSSGFVVNNVFTVNDSVNLSGNSAAVVNGSIAAASVNVNDASSLVVNNPGTVSANVNVGTSGILGLFGRINGNVVNAGFFQGTGRVSGNVTNSGLVSPGASIGTLTIGGNFTQTANGTLRIEVEGSSAGQYDVLAVGGRANLGGRLQLVRLGNFQLRVGDQIAFLTAGGGVSGTFANVENDFLATGSIVVFDVVYLPNTVVLEGTQGLFAEFAATFCGTPNAIAVGEALDSAVGDPRASELIGFLNQQTLPDLCDDIGLISPEQLTSMFVVGVSLANVQTANLQRRMGDIRAGSTGFSSSGFAVNGSGPSFWEGFPSGQGFAGVSGAEGKSGPSVFAPIPQNRWGAFVTGIGEFTNVDSTFNASGYDLATGGFTAGLDYRIGSNFAVGLTGGYAYTGADLVNDSSIDVNGGKLGLYATAFGSGFYLDTAVIGGLNGYDTRRTALEGTANGETIGGDLNVLVAAGYDWKAGGLSVGPTASFQYTLVGFDSFSESGSLAPLAYPSQNADSYRTAFGMRASYDWKIGPVHFIPEVRAAWQHEFGDTDYSLVSSFASGAGNSFTVVGPEIGRDSLLLSAGFAIQWSDRISTYAYYDGELFRINYLSNNVSVGVRITF